MHGADSPGVSSSCTVIRVQRSIVILSLSDVRTVGGSREESSGDELGKGSDRHLDRGKVGFLSRAANAYS